MSQDRVLMADQMRRGWDFACAWYSVEEIEHGIKRQPETVPSDVNSREFAEFLTEQYRLAMAKGIQIGRDWAEGKSALAPEGTCPKCGRRQMFDAGNGTLGLRCLCGYATQGGQG